MAKQDQSSPNKSEIVTEDDITAKNAYAWLAVIRYAEGTAKYQNPYGVAFTGAIFDNSKPHPGTVYGSSGGYQSDAHGAYQFLGNTWSWINGNKNIPMTKENQDKAAWNLMRNRGVDPSTAMTRQRLAQLSPEWASLPNWNGLSYYGQPVKSYGELAHVWATALRPYWTQA